MDDRTDESRPTLRWFLGGAAAGHPGHDPPGDRGRTGERGGLAQHGRGPRRLDDRMRSPAAWRRFLGDQDMV